MKGSNGSPLDLDNIGDFQSRTNLNTILAMLGFPDDANGALLARLGALTSTENLVALLGTLTSTKSLTDIIELILPEYCMYYPFNHPVAAIDADFWTAGGDSGGFTVLSGDDDPTGRKLFADTATDNDYYIHGDGKYAKVWNFQSADYSTITFEAKVALGSTADVSMLFGLVNVASLPTGYAEPAVDSALFIVDDGVSANFIARTYDAAEEETASDIPLDTDAHVFKLVWTSADVKFYIDGVLKATHETQVPDSPMAVVFLLRTEADAEKYANVEYSKVYVA